MPAGQISGKLNLNAAGWSSAVDKAKREIKSLQDASRDAGHGTVSSMQAASASIRLIEGDMTRNVRAVERFITTIPGVGKALQAAFPLVGAAALAGIIFRVGEEATKAIQKIQQAPQVISNAFREMNLSAETSIDSLNLSTAKMQEQIALLSGKRPNTLAEDLANASLAADKLATSLDADNRKIAELLKANGLSALSGLLGKAGTAEVGGSVNYFDQQMSDLAARHQHAVRTGDTSGAADLAKQLDDKRAAALNYANSQIGQRQQGQGPGSLNQDANLAVLTGFRNTLVDQQDQEGAEKSNTATAAQLKKLEDAKKYAEMQKQAQAELLKVYEEQEKQQNAFNKLTINEEIKFWSDRISAFSKGGQAYLQVQDKIYDLIAKRPDLFSENKKNQASAGKSQVEGNDLLAAGAEALKRPQVEQYQKMLEAQKKLNEAQAQAEEIQRKSTTAFAETSLSIALAQGAISKLDAAQALAAIHARDHADAIELVNKQLQAQLDLINDPGSKLTPDEKTAASGEATRQAENQTAVIEGTYSRTQAQDQASISADTISGAVKTSLDQMVQSFTDLASNLKSVIPQTIGSLNDDIAKTITGHGSKQDFSRTLTGAGQGLIKTGLQGAEGKLLGSFGLGKRDGSSQLAALWVQVAAASAGLTTSSSPATSGVGAAASLIPGSQFFRPFIGGQQGGQAGGGGGGSIWGQLLHSFLPGLKLGGGGGGGGPVDYDGFFQGGFAGGGDVLANRDFLVGEQGPELLRIGARGHVTPNGQLGGSTGHTFNIDARGSNDPSAVEAAVRRAAPHIAAAGVQATHQNRMRSPGGR